MQVISSRCNMYVQLSRSCLGPSLEGICAPQYCVTTAHFCECGSVLTHQAFCSVCVSPVAVSFGGLLQAPHPLAPSQVGTQNPPAAAPAAVSTSTPRLVSSYAAMPAELPLFVVLSGHMSHSCTASLSLSLEVCLCLYLCLYVSLITCLLPVRFCLQHPLSPSLNLPLMMMHLLMTPLMPLQAAAPSPTETRAAAAAAPPARTGPADPLGWTLTSPCPQCHPRRCPSVARVQVG